MVFCGGATVSVHEYYLDLLLLLSSTKDIITMGC